jgi:glyoxylate reductase
MERMMQKPRIFLTRRIPQAGIDLLARETDVQVWPDELPPSYEVLLESVRGAAGLVTLLSDKIDQKVIQAAGPSLKVISQYAVGIDNIDLVEATRLGIAVGHTPGVLTETTADLAWALLMAAARRVVEGDRSVRNGLWKTWGPTAFLGYDIHGATLGILGLGRIGQAMARRGKGFGMRVLYTDLKHETEVEKELGIEFAPFEQLLKESDFLSLHTYLSPETYHLFGDAQFKMMKPGAILVNTARGAIVDHDALYRALRDKTIAGAGLDVTDPEPIPMNSPLLGLDNLVITPHIASASYQTRTQMAVMTAENLLAGLKGDRLPYCANPAVYQM